MQMRLSARPDGGARGLNRTWRRVALAALVLASSLWAQNAGSPENTQLSLEDVLARMATQDEARVAALKHYWSARRYTLQNHRFGTSAQLDVEMHYRHPGTKALLVVSEKGSRIIRDRVLKRMIKAELEAARPEIQASTQITPRNYTFQLLATEMRGTRRCYVLEAVPKVPNKFLFRGRIWVDSEDFAIVRIQGVPALNPSFWIRKTSFVHEYQKFGSFWLPVANRSTTDAFLFGRTEVGIEYSLYRINEADPGKKGANGQETVTLDGVGSPGDDWRAQFTNGKNTGQR